MKKQRFSFINCILVIFFGFLLTSVGHLSWMYHLMEQTSAELSFQLSTVAGYGLQAVGMGAFIALSARTRISPRNVFVAALTAYAACLIPSVLGSSLPVSVVFGFLLSLFCGVIAGYYLYELTASVPKNRRALSFGCSYGAATVASWLLSLPGGGSAYSGAGAVIIGLVLTALTVLAAVIKPALNEKALQTERMPAEKTPQAVSGQQKPRMLLLIAGGVVLLFSLVNNIGFSYSASAVQDGLRPEFSRLFYAVGLIAAGVVTDLSRKHGAVCALASLVLPFVVPALKGNPFSVVFFWALGYFAFGFYAVYRVVVFSDVADSRGLPLLAVSGLLIGRLGDALGAELQAAFAWNEAALVMLSAALFIGAVFLFIRLFQMLYNPEPVRQKSEREVFNDFAVRYSLSDRERDVLRLLLDNKSNKEISAAICVSENTVKFHVRNLLQKTDCKNRVELKAAYHNMESASLFA